MSYSRIKKRAESENITEVLPVVRDFLADPDIKKLSPRTQEEYGYNLPLFASWCDSHALQQNKRTREWSVTKPRDHHESIHLHQIDNQVVSLFIEHIRETHAPSKNSDTELSSWTIHQYVKDIKRFLNWCVQDEQYHEHVNATTVARIQKPKIEQKIIEVFCDEDIFALQKACDKEISEHLRMRDRVILSLFLDTGLRVSELVHLHIDQVILAPNDPYIKVLGKGRKWGEIPLGEHTRRLMSKYLRTFREPTIEFAVDQETYLQNYTARQKELLKKSRIEESLFFVNRAGKPLTRNGVLQLMHRLAEFAGIEDHDVRFSPHTWRHTFAWRFMQKGGDIYILSRILRHSSVKVTEVYLRSLKPRDIRQQARGYLA